MKSITGIILFASIIHCSSGAYIHTPLVNVSELIGRDVSFHCAVSGVQESWEFMQWVKVSPAPAEVVAVDNVTLDDTKYKISNYYNLTIKNIGVDDDSIYTCSMGVEEYEAKLTVSDYPDSCSLTKEVFSDHHMNLTCISKNSRPEAIISWFRGEVDITDYAYHPKPDLDSNGYGDTMSVLTLDEDMAMPGLHHDEGYFYTCNIDLPGLPGVFVESVYVGSGESLRSLGITSTILTVICTVLISRQR